MIEVNETNVTVNVTVNETTQSVSIEVPVQGGGSGAVNSVNGKNGTVTLNQDEIPDGTTYKRYSLTEKNKLSSITEIFTTALKTAYDGVVSGYTALMLTGSRLITSGEITKLSNTIGTNTGDQDLTGYATETFVLENVPEVDTSLFAVQDGTVLYQKKPTRINGTITNVGNVVTGIGTTFENPYSLVGAKIIKANGETAIIATITNNTSLTTVLPFATDSVNSAYQLRAKAIEIIDDGDGKILMYDRVNQRKIFESTDDGHVIINGAFFDKNGYIYTMEILKTRQYIPALIYNTSTINPSPGDVGMTVTVNDALTPTYGGVYVGGGAEVCQVIWSGTNWKTR